MNLSRLLTPVAALVAGGLACGDPATTPNPTPDTTPATLSVVSGTGQSGTTGGQLGAPFVVRVQNAGGDPLSGVTIDWTVVSGGGTLSAASSTTNAQGDAQVSYTLGPNAGANQVKAMVRGGTLEANLTATGNAPPVDNTPADILIVSGNTQSAVVGTQLPSPLVVRVANASNQGLSGVMVDWAVTGGGGTLGTATSATSAQGQASTTYTVGSTAGVPNTVTATVQGAPTLTVTFDLTASAVSGTAAVTVDDNFFNPDAATVAAGGDVTWTWAGSVAHNVTWVAGGFTNSATQTAGSHQVNFPSTGAFDYYCSIHGTPTTGMRGSVTVQ